MNYKIVFIALVLMLACVIPASAVWSNGNWIDSEHSEQYFGTAKVVTDPATGVTSKYNPITSEIDLMTYQGHVYGNLKSGHVLEGGERFLISNDLAPNVTKEYKFNSDGLFDDYFAEGNYTITLPQGTGSAAGVYTEDVGWIGNLHPEVAHINVKAGQTTYFTFIGNSVPTIVNDVCVPKYKIIDATYGFGHQSCHDVTVHHGDYNKVHHDAVPYTPDTYQIVTYGPYDGHCKIVTGWDYDFQIGSTKYKKGNTGSYNLHYRFIEGTYGTPAWDEYVYVGDGNGDYVWWYGHFHHVDTTTEQQCTTDGTVIDVTSNVQSVVDGGATQFRFLFDNAQNPGGIFDATGSTLLSEINDPAFGYEKDVTINYENGCGITKTIKTKEYKVIDLSTGKAQ